MKHHKWPATQEYSRSQKCFGVQGGLSQLSQELCMLQVATLLGGRLYDCVCKFDQAG